MTHVMTSPVLSCILCDHTSKTANGVYLHSMAKHPQEMSAAFQDAHAAIQRIRELHAPSHWCCEKCDGCDNKMCVECQHRWPCPTIEALDGGDSVSGENVTADAFIDENVTAQGGGQE